MYKNKIKETRKLQGITLMKLSEITGISAGYICHLEKGTRKNPSVQMMEKIASALNKSIHELFFDE